MVLTLDIGNTNIIMGGMEDGRAVFISRLATVRSRSADEYAVLLSLLARQRGADLMTSEGAIISSVVPELTSVMKEAVALSCGKVPLVVGPGVKTGLNIRIDDPSELGADFVATAVAAVQGYPLPCATVDMGTATSIGVIDAKGSHIGCIICPGVMVSHNSLANSTSQLPHIGLDAPGRLIGKGTRDSMKSGLVYGFASMIDGLLDRIEDELGEKLSVVATGDWAGDIIKHCLRHDISLDDELLIRGLWLIYHKNRK